MKLTIINYFFKFNKSNKPNIFNKSYYTFKKEEHEIVLLKKLDDNKISYNSQTYEKDFFEYYKLEAFVQKVYDIRDFELKNWFKTYYNDAKNEGYSRDILNPNPWESLNWENLTSAQYNMLIKCHKYDFYYPLEYDLVDIYSEVPDRTKVSALLYDWLYIVGWKSIKPVFPTFKITGIHANYVDEPRTIEKKEELEFRHEYDPFDEGTRFVFESYPEYDEQKKFNEFDINCKTNSYYMRYKAYNEIFCKDYPEHKKFKTDLVHDFTEEEIQENYENMINKEKSAMDKWNHVMLNEKNKKAVLALLSELESIEVSTEIWYYPTWTWFYEELADSHTDLAKSIESEVEEVLTDPRNLLVMPLLDAYFEIYREKGWYNGDKTFCEYYPVTKKYWKHLAYFDFSYERYYMTVKDESVIFDYVDMDFEDYEDEYEDEYDLFTCAFVLFFWLVGVSLYTFCFWFMYYNYHDNIFQIVPEYLNSVTNYIIHKPKIYYGLELRVPRTYYGKRKRYSKPCNITYRFNPVRRPTNFFYDSTYRLRLNSSHNWAPINILDKISEDLDEKDYGLNQLDENMRQFSYKYGIYRLRIYGIEEGVSEEEQLFVPKIKRAYLRFHTWFFRMIKKYIVDTYLGIKYPDDPRFWSHKKQVAYELEQQRLYEERKEAEKQALLLEQSKKKWYNITRYF
jgi:hypothetical protein